MTKKEPKEFKVGHMYTVQYRDHWISMDEHRDELESDFHLRSHGVCIKNTPNVVMLEFQQNVSDPHPTNKRLGTHGIVKSTIVWVADYGPEKVRR